MAQVPVAPTPCDVHCVVAALLDVAAEHVAEADAGTAAPPESNLAAA